MASEHASNHLHLNKVEVDIVTRQAEMHLRILEAVREDAFLATNPAEVLFKEIRFLAKAKAISSDIREALPGLI